MTVENLPFSNLDRLNRNVNLSGNKRYALGGVVDPMGELAVKPRNRLFPIPPPFLPSLGKKFQQIPFGKPHA
jgi:hypothetical protein